MGSQPTERSADGRMGGQIDSAISSKAIRKITGTSIAVRKEIMRIMADTRSSGNHYMSKAANIADRA